MIDPYAHPQHMKVVNHLLYIWSGCEKHSTWVWSLNHCTKALLSTKQWPGISADFPNLDRPVWLQWHDDGSISHPQHMKVVKHLLYVWSGCDNHTMWLWSLNHCRNTEIQHHIETRDFRRLPKLGLTCVVETAWWSQERPRRVTPVRWQIKGCLTTEPRTFDSWF